MGISRQNNGLARLSGAVRPRHYPFSAAICNRVIHALQRRKKWLINAH
jgi:hypothetical protein